MKALVTAVAVGPADVPAWTELRAYIARIKLFSRQDWWRYSAWMATVFSLFVGVTAFLAVGLHGHVDYPGYVFFIPFGTLLFASALAVDDIGHRTVYKAILRRGEGYVHQMIVLTAVPSVMALCLCYQHPEVWRMPALGMILLSLFYSALDEAMHWHRYLTYGIDRVEMWSHFVAISGHVLMIGAWWQWYAAGYPGVAQTLTVLGGAG